VYELGTRFGIHRVTVGRLLRARGVNTTPPGLHPDDLSEAIDLYRAGLSTARIAKKFGTTQSTVWLRLREAGVVMRKRWERGNPGKAHDS
jgi:DNA invertase Pin-like site-specific DNA recombinase